MTSGGIWITLTKFEKDTCAKCKKKELEKKVTIRLDDVLRFESKDEGSSVVMRGGSNIHVKESCCEIQREIDSKRPSRYWGWNQPGVWWSYPYYYTGTGEPANKEWTLTNGDNKIAIPSTFTTETSIDPTHTINNTN